MSPPFDPLLLSRIQFAANILSLLIGYFRGKAAVLDYRIETTPPLDAIPSKGCPNER